ncbi:MAG: PHB depolymerase family esterase [Ilumatobacteraceae bacterium]
MRRPIAILVLSALVVSCSGGGNSTDSTDSSASISDETTTPTSASDVGSTVAESTTPASTEATIATLPADQVAQLVAARPYNFFVPSSYVGTTALPLVLMLHGFRSNAGIDELYLQLQPLAEERDFIYVFPEGTFNEVGEQFWNATDACCGGSSTVDDSTYLRAVIDDVKSKLMVDQNRVFIIGYSNGGFMAHRMACDHADAIAGIVSIAGAVFLNPADCVPSEPVSMLQVHGTNDSVIQFGGGTFMQPFAHPSAFETAEFWAADNACTSEEVSEPYDHDPLFAGIEAYKQSYGTCAADTAVELWYFDGQGHAPIATSTVFTLVDFLFAHPKA